MPFQDRWGQVCGFLNYEEKENSSRFIRRYFIISDKERAILGYYDSPANLPEGTMPSIRISLSIISHARDVSKQRPKIELCFVITTPERNYYFQADSQEDKDDWIAKVTNACKVTVPTKGAPKSPTHSAGEGKGDQLSYRTDIVGGVVVRTPVNPPLAPGGNQTTTDVPPVSDSDSDGDDHQQPDRRSLPPYGQQFPGPTPTKSPSSKFIVEGWCVKQGAVRKSWKRRYFALGDDGVSYFKSENDKVPIRTIPLSEMLNCKASGQWSALQRDNLFEINCYSRTFFVQAYTPQEMGQWVNAINSKIENSKEEAMGYEPEDTHL